MCKWLYLLNGIPVINIYYLQALSDKCFMSHDASIFMNIHELEITDSDVHIGKFMRYYEKKVVSEEY